MKLFKNVKLKSLVNQLCIFKQTVLSTFKRELKPLIVIVAVDRNNAIGYKGKMLTHNMKDLKHFKETTYGHVVIAGRKTYESIPKPLTNRTFIVVTTDKNYKARKDTIVVDSFEKAHKIASTYANKKIFVIGGGEIYKQAVNIASELIITRFNFKAPRADTYFNEVPSSFKLSLTAYLEPNTKVQYYTRKNDI